MLTQEEVEKFADWIISQEKKLMDIKHPKADLPDNITDEELLELLFA